VNPVRVLWRSMSGQHRQLAFAAFLGAIASASAVALLGASGYLISWAAELPPVLTLTTAAVMVRAFALSRGVFRYVERLVGHDAAFRGLTALRVRVYERVEALAPVGLARFTRGDLLSRIVADVDAAMDIPLRVILPWGQAILVSLATAAFLVWLLPPVAAVIAGLAVIAIAGTPALVNARVRKAEQALAPSQAAMRDVVVSTLDAQADLLAFGAVPAALATVQSRDSLLTRIAKRESGSLGIAGGIGIVVQGIAVVASLSLAIPAVTSGDLPPVWLAVVVFLPLALFDVLNSLPTSAVAYQSIRGSAQRVVDLDDVPLPVHEPQQPISISDGFTGIQCTELTAGWNGSPVLHGVSFDVHPGERVAIVGPSGSGKSTIAAALMGFISYEGQLTFNGAEIRDINGDVLRTHITLLSQRAHMFDTSIADNVRIGHPQASDEEVSQALAHANILDWVNQLPDGIHTEVGTFGAAISGGERQRIALARVLLAQRPCIIFDEPTEHLDVETAEHLDRTMLDATRDRTTVIITHRLHDIADADRIYVLDHGHVVAHGDRALVTAKSPWFAEQWQREEAQQHMRDVIGNLPVGVGVPISH